MSRSPLVSVLVPTYNGARYLDETLAAIAGQSYRRLEVVVRDDGSTDGTLEIIGRYCADDPRFRLIRSEGPHGAYENTRALMALPQGEFVKICCQDDVLERRSIEVMVKGMADPSVTLATSRRALVDERSGVLPARPYTEPLTASDDVLDGASVARRVLLLNLNQIGEPSCVLMRNGILDPADPFRYGTASVDVNADLAMWLTLLGQGNLFYAAGALSRIRVHGAQRSADLDVQIAGALEWVDLFEAGLRQDVVTVGEQSMFAGRRIMTQLQGVLNALVTSERPEDHARVPHFTDALARAWRLTLDGAGMRESALV